MQQPLATQAAYRTYTGDETAEVSVLTLRRASNVIRGALVGFTVYDVDDNGVPTDTKVAATLTEATCAQVAYWDEVGESGTGADDRIQSSSVLGASWSKTTGPNGAPSARDLC